MTPVSNPNVFSKFKNSIKTFKNIKQKDDFRMKNQNEIHFIKTIQNLETLNF